MGNGRFGRRMGKGELGDKAVTGLLFGVILVAIGAWQVFADAYCYSKLWSWYLVPAGAPEVPWSSWIGIVILIGMVKFRAHKPRNIGEVVDSTSSLQNTGQALLLPWVALAIGWMWL